jgi:hypothetical protein
MEKLKESQKFLRNIASFIEVFFTSVPVFKDNISFSKKKKTFHIGAIE